MKKIYYFILLFSAFVYAQNIQGIEVGYSQSISLEEPVYEPTTNSEVSPMGTPTGGSQEVGVLAGTLSVSNSGAANYIIPILVPSGINGIQPDVSLGYSSQGGNGIAGYGWALDGISKITRIPSTKYHDYYIDPVDFDSYDRFALDGQRLIKKSGSTYGGNGTIYETENFSNIRITSYGVSPYGSQYGPSYFKVEYPDGSFAYYGNSNVSQTRTEWAITYWENPQGLRIDYDYIEDNTNNIHRISSIKYGGKTESTHMNEIQFVYKNRQRSESYGIGGVTLVENQILSEIKVLGNSIGFRNYILSYDVTNLKYERLRSITEKSGDNSKSLNPTKFSYNNTSESLLYSLSSTSLVVGNINMNSAEVVTGFFDDDNKMDFILYPKNDKTKYWVMQSGGVHISNTGIGTFKEILPVDFLMNHPNGTDYQLSTKQGYAIVKETTTQVTIDVYNTTPSGGIVLQYQRVINNSDLGGNVEREYHAGDFNGDGLTDVMCIVKSNAYCYFVNLDRRITSGFYNYCGAMYSTGISSIDQVMIGDFNGDGKSDIFHFTNGIVKISGFGNTNTLQAIHQRSSSDLNPTNSILMGDYNGDGKSDFIIPSGGMPGATSYNKFISTGKSTVKTTADYGIPYYEDSENYYLATDMDGDGKSDLITINNIDNYITVKVYKDTGSGFTLFNTKSTGYVGQIDPQAVPIFLPSDTDNKKLELGLITNKYILNFSSTKDFNNEKLLRSIISGNGVVDAIYYHSLTNCGTGCVENYYPDTNNSTLSKFPYYDIVNENTMTVVSKLQRQSTTVNKKQYYQYMGAVYNFEGLGFIGFKQTLKTNWHQNNNEVISEVTINDILKRGALVQDYTVLGWGVLSSSYQPTNYITKLVNTYQESLSSTKVYNLKKWKSTSYNGLDNTSESLVNIYDAYNHPTSSTIATKQGSTTIRSTAITYEYYNDTSGSVYYTGRPKRTFTSITHSGSTMTSEELYSYTNHLLTQVQKKGHETDYVTEVNDFDDFGNITEKSITAGSLAPRVTSYEYDPTGRFLTSITDVEGQTKNLTYNYTTGNILTETNAIGLTIEYTYDAFGRKIKEKNFLGNESTYTYSNLSSGYYQVISQNADGAESITKYDDLSRKIVEGTKQVDGDYLYRDYNYDKDDRVIGVSELYKSTPSQFTTTEYDIYGRPVTITEYTGKTTTVEYNGLLTTTNDGVKTVITRKNVLGNVTSVTDDGGNITYQYFPNGNLKRADYDGIVTSFEQDGWGRRTKLTDPSAGIYTYEYNAFGQIKKETTPKGTSTYGYDNFGKISYKIDSGVDGNAGQTSYYYDTTTKQISIITYDDTNSYTNYVDFTYDQYGRTKEINELSTNWQTGNPIGDINYTTKYSYNSLGQKENETSYASYEGESTNTAVKYVYSFGSLQKILDSATSKVLWQVEELDSRGLMTKFKLGSINAEKTYDTYGLPSVSKFSVSGNQILKLTSVFDAQRKNLLSRSYESNYINRSESFLYDNLDRLTHYTNIRGEQEEQVYDYRGRISQNTLGQFEYSDSSKPYQQTAAQLTEIGKSYYYKREGIFQSGMEDGNDWLLTDSTNMSYDETKFYSGGHSLKVVNANSTDKIVNADKKVSVSIPTGGVSYVISGWVYSDGPVAQLHMVMSNESTTYTSYVSSTTTNDWQYIYKVVTVPVTMNSLSARVINKGGGTVWFDDITIVKQSDIVTPRELDIKYSMLKKPVEISESGVDRISFDYNTGGSRTGMYYGSTDTDFSARPYRKFYSSYAGNIEIKHNIVNNKIEFLTFIGGDAYESSVVFRKQASVQGEYLYLIKDYLGSVLQITNSLGSVLESRSFDAWGNICKIVNGNGKGLANFSVFDRGYTSHEHMLTVGLINMNGRLYDSKLHRFLQPDNFVQEPYSTQSFNRYGYVWNNPLKYTDKSGEFVIITAIIVGAVVGAYFGGAQANKSYNPLKWNYSSTETWAGMGLGALVGGVTGYIGAGISAGLAGGLAAEGIGGFLGGLISEGVSGIVTGALDGFIFPALPGGDGDMVGGAANGALFGGIFGGLSGGLFRGFKALRNKLNFWTGRPLRPALSTLAGAMPVGMEPPTVQPFEVDAIVAEDVISSLGDDTIPVNTIDWEEAQKLSQKIEDGLHEVIETPGLSAENTPNMAGTTSGTPTGVPNSVYDYYAPGTNYQKRMSSYFYDAAGNVEFQIDWFQNKPSRWFNGHGHFMSVPGNLGSGHLPQNHIPFMLVPLDKVKK